MRPPGSSIVRGSCRIENDSRNRTALTRRSIAKDRTRIRTRTLIPPMLLMVYSFPYKSLDQISARASSNDPKLRRRRVLDRAEVESHPALREEPREPAVTGLIARPIGVRRCLEIREGVDRVQIRILSHRLLDLSEQI